MTKKNIHCPWENLKVREPKRANQIISHRFVYNTKKLLVAEKFNVKIFCYIIFELFCQKYVDTRIVKLLLFFENKATLISMNTMRQHANSAI